MVDFYKPERTPEYYHNYLYFYEHFNIPEIEESCARLAYMRKKALAT